MKNFSAETDREAEAEGVEEFPPHLQARGGAEAGLPQAAPTSPADVDRRGLPGPSRVTSPPLVAARHRHGAVGPDP